MFNPQESNEEVAIAVREIMNSDVDPYYVQALLAISNSGISVDDTCTCISAVSSQVQRDMVISMARELHTKLCALMERIQ